MGPDLDCSWTLETSGTADGPTPPFPTFRGKQQRDKKRRRGLQSRIPSLWHEGGQGTHVFHFPANERLLTSHSTARQSLKNQASNAGPILDSRLARFRLSAVPSSSLLLFLLNSLLFFTDSSHLANTNLVRTICQGAFQVFCKYELASST